MGKCDAKSAEALVGLYKKYNAAMREKALFMLVREDYAEEAMQEAYVRLLRWLDRHGEPEDEKLAASICILAVISAAKDKINAAKRHTLFSESIGDEITLQEYYDMNDAVFVGECFLNLSDNERSILHLYCIEGYTCRKTSLICGKSENAVRKTAERAKKKLLDTIDGK